MFFTNLNWGTTNVCYEIFKKKLDLRKSTRDIKRGFISCSRFKMNRTLCTLITALLKLRLMCEFVSFELLFRNAILL